jgi:hypothetical protein
VPKTTYSGKMLIKFGDFFKIYLAINPGEFLPRSNFVELRHSQIIAGFP